MSGRVSACRSAFLLSGREISFWWQSFVQGTQHVSLKVSHFLSCNQSMATSQGIVYWKPLLCLYSQQDPERMRAMYQINFG
jgi:hypothetical protein